jgi:hypothetical protein
VLDPSDTRVPRTARVYDALLGGKDNYEADRIVAAELSHVAPELPAMVRAERGFLRRIVPFLVRDAGLRQLLDIGTGIPASPNVHELAQAIAPETRVVYVDDDPAVLVHARALLRSGRTAVVEADLRDSAALLDRRAVGRVLDLDRPVGVLLLGVLQHVPDADDPWSAVRQIVGALPAGSYVAVAALASDLDVELVEDVVGAAARFGIQISPRPRDAVAAFLQGLDLVGPGVVPLLDWRLSPADDALDWLLDRLGVLDVPVWAGVGRTS